MGDEVDAFDLPSRLQSGNGDSHQSTIVEPDEEAVREQSQANLDKVREDFFSRNTNVNSMIAAVEGLGYSDTQRRHIIGGILAEHQYRLGHNNVPSGLQNNQIEYIANQTNALGSPAFNLNSVNIMVDDRGRTYIEDRRVRETDGTPRRLYLPPPVPFDPISRRARQQLQYEESIVDDITIQNPDISDIRNHLLIDDISQENVDAVSQIITQYLQGNRNDQDRDEMRHRIQELPDLSQTVNIREKLIILFDDINQEEQYRVDNDGRPRGLTDEEWDYIQDNSDTLNYYGQPILRTQTDPPTKYFYTGTGYTVLEPNNIRNIPTAQITQSQQREINLFTQGYITGEDNDNNPDNLANNLSSLFNEPDFATRLQLEDIAQRAEAERVFRAENNGRPSQLTPLQYQFVMNHNLSPDEPRYSGEPIQTITSTIRGTTITQQGFNSWDNQEFPDLLVIPTDDIINQLIENGAYTPPEPTADPDRPPVVLPPTPPIIEPPISDPQIIPPEEILPESLEPPVIQGQTQPVNPITQGDIPVDTLERNIQRYEQHFNSQQRQYEPFRQMFRDILPIFTGFSGGFFAFSYSRSRDRGTIGEILQNERVFLNTIESRITTAQRNLGRPLRPDDPETQVGLANIGFPDPEIDFSEIPLKDLVPQLSNRRDDLLELQAQLPPDTAFALRGTYQYQFNEPERFRIQQELNTVQELIQEAESELDSLEMDIANDEASRQEVNQRLDELINLDTQILQNVYRYNPQILSGFTIGTTLGLVLSGYFFPTYVDVEDASYFNREYDKPEIENKAQPLLHDPAKDVKNDVLQMKMRDPKEIKSRIHQSVPKQFIPVKDNRGKQLSYKEIQELKSTLSPSELNNLKDKYLVFGDDNKPSHLIQDKCKAIVGETIISKRPIKLR